MNWFGLSGLLTGLSCTAMGLWVYRKNPHKPLNRIWSIFCVSVAVWGYGVVAISCAQERETAHLYWKLAYTGVFFIASLFYHFVVIFLGLDRRATVRWGYGISVFFVLINASDLILPDVHKLFDGFWYANPTGPLFPAFALHFFGLVTVSHIELWRYMRNSRDPHRVRQVKWFFVATALGFTGGSMCYLPTMGIPVRPYGNFAVPLYPVIMGYAIVKYQLMDIQVAIRRTAYYTLSVAVLSAAYALIVIAVYRALVPEGSRVFVSIASAILVGFVIMPTERWLRGALDRLFFKGTITEISELNQKLETELERRERLKSVGILAAGMAHEIKNPLTVIQTFAEHLPSKYGDADFRDKFHRLVTAEVGRMRRIVEDLLAYSKPKDPVLRPCDVDAVLRDILTLVDAQAVRQNIRVEQRLSPARALVDADQIKQAALNILVNAIEAMPQGGALEVRSSVLEDWVVIEIKDSGCGISKESLAHIFDPFYTNKDSGTGLGLAITHTIIERNGGSIAVSSRAGEGTRFELRLPLC
ncbi:MAG: Adaptive-response sensory-kinase SasA [Candidatus Omnitrophica bacterium]|nr:Adaptive-response sensory-kinase SasA [Candidatus Omnitrophota bacterium]